jgi:hypothetical protein
MGFPKQSPKRRGRLFSAWGGRATLPALQPTEEAMRPAPLLFAALLLAAPALAASDYLSEVKAEPAVKDAKLDGGTLLVGVLDDGTDRRGFAEYLCLGAPPEVHRVRVMDVVKAARGEWKELGTAPCQR